MTAGSISATVSRAFTVIGIFFMLGGPYMGGLLYVFAPEAIPVDVRIEKVHQETITPSAGEPSYVQTVADVTYIFEGKTYQGQIVSRHEDPGWTAGATVSAFLLSTVPEDVRTYTPEETAEEKHKALIVAGGMFATGALLFLMAFFGGRGDRKRHKELVALLSSRSYGRSMGYYSGSATEYSDRYPGFSLMGIVLTLIGGLLSVGISWSLIPALLRTPLNYSFDTLILFFPLCIGIGILIMGLLEFQSLSVTVTRDRILIQHRRLGFGRSREVPLSSCFGLVERITATHRPHQVRQDISREYVPLHTDRRIFETTVFKVPDDDTAWHKVREFSAFTGLPVVKEDAEEILIISPDGSEQIAGKSEPLPADAEFKSRYLKLKIDEPRRIAVRRASGAGIVWGIGFLAAGTAGAIASSALSVLIPTIVMAAFLIGIGGKADLLTVDNDSVRLEERFFGRPYNTVEIPCTDIERIAVDTDPRSHMTRCLVINGRGRRINFAQSSPRQELEWLARRIRRICNT